MGTPIESLFAGRVRNALLRGGIDTIEKLLTCNDDDLMRLRNFGLFCLRDVNEKLGYLRVNAGSTARACSRQG